MDCLTDFSLLALSFDVFAALRVAIGLGLVIFFHELGHFAVAKWCDVEVERFSIGFGPILWRIKKGETEYALSAIPLGGYVKMLGQDDMDPSQLTQEEIAEDPRSFSAKSVPQRMGIISAGVIMNVVTGLLFFAIAFQLGVEQTPRIVGGAQPGYPAWEAGIREGDRIDRIGGRRITSFSDVQRAVALTASKTLVVEGMHADQSRFRVELQPYSPNDNDSVRQRLIGVTPMSGLETAKMPEGRAPVVTGSAADKAKPAVPGGHVVAKVDGEAVTDFTQLQALVTAKRGSEVTLELEPVGEDAGKPTKVELPAAPFRTLGLRFEIGQVAAVRADSPAANAGLRAGDKITHVVADGVEEAIGKDLDPFRLPDRLHELAGKDVEIRYSREVPGSDREDHAIHLVPDARPGWTEPPSREGVPLSIPAIGLAFHVIPRVHSVEEDGPVSGEVTAGAKLVEWKLVKDPEAPTDGYKKSVIEIDLDGKQPNLAYAFWLTQHLPGRKVQLVVKSGEEPAKTLDVETVAAEDWYLPGTRGLLLYSLAEMRPVDGFGDALGAACLFTKNSITDIYLTLRNVALGELSATNFSGPVGIFEMGVKVAAQGYAPLLMFLGILSMNLAVINFLPIPVLDGGHMVFLLWEGITRKKPSERVVVVSTNVGVALILGLVCFVMYLDLFYNR